MNEEQKLTKQEYDKKRRKAMTEEQKIQKRKPRKNSFTRNKRQDKQIKYWQKIV